ncbi:MAG: hypothetical protein ISS41_03320 [Candidatus Aminicenantes bacterium]|nr:hypothetical protein [Candidatus Aminicenantes bacterium]
MPRKPVYGRPYMLFEIKDCSVEIEICPENQSIEIKIPGVFGLTQGNFPSEILMELKSLLRELGHIGHRIIPEFKPNYPGHRSITEDWEKKLELRRKKKEEEKEERIAKRYEKMEKNMDKRLKQTKKRADEPKGDKGKFWKKFEENLDKGIIKDAQGNLSKVKNV